ncbi:MAG: DegV family protein [Eggerthia catenaformis]|uniref:DegV family protein n=1 Tax=Eggerthia catenaformis TaxID=31973 RepID=UPI003F9F9B96
MYKIMSDTSCEMTLAQAQERNIELISFYMSANKKDYKKEVREWAVRDFYQFMVDHPRIFPTTSMPSTDDYYSAFKEVLGQNMDIICICTNAQFSGSYNAARLAGEMALEEYPDRRIEVIDATFNTVCHRLLLEEVVRLRNENTDYDELIDRIKIALPTGHIYFTAGNMDYLIAGGRLNKTVGKAANGLSIKPMLHLNSGKLSLTGIARGRKGSMNKALKQCIEYFKKENLNTDDYLFIIGYGYDIKEGEDYCSFVHDAFLSELNHNITITTGQIGATIAVHTGPYPIGIAFLRKL